MLAHRFQGDNLTAQLHDTAIALIRHSDPGVRRSAWRLIKKMDIEHQSGLIDAFISEEHLEVMEIALFVVLPILSTCGQKEKENIVIAKCQQLVTFLLQNNLVDRHPLLFRRILPLVPLDEAIIFDGLASWSCITWLDILARSKYLDQLACDQKVSLVKRFIDDEDPNIVYGGLLILERCAGSLGIKITELQESLCNFVKGNNVQLAFQSLNTLLSIVNVSNWEALVNFALEYVWDRRNAKSAALERHIWEIKILKGLVVIVEGFCRREKEDWLRRILEAVPEKASIDDIEMIVGAIARDCTIHLNISNGKHPNRALVYSNLCENDAKVDLRFDLLKKEVVMDSKRDPFALFKTSIFYEVPKSGAVVSKDKKIVLDHDSHEEEIGIILPPELMADIFTGFAHVDHLADP